MIFPLKIVIFPLKIVIFPLKWVIFQSLRDVIDVHLCIYIYISMYIDLFLWIFILNEHLLPSNVGGIQLSDN